MPTGSCRFRNWANEYFHYDRDSQTLMGDRSGLTLGLGTPVTVRLTEAVPVTGGLLLELVSVEGAAMPAGGASGPRTPPPRPSGGRWPGLGANARHGAARPGTAAANRAPARSDTNGHCE